MNRFIPCFMILASYFLLFPPPAAAAMQDESYSVEKQTIEIKPYQPARREPQREIDRPLKEGFNYTVDSTTREAFSFSVSSDLIDFGELSATNPVIRKLSLKVTSPIGFQVLTTENHPLQMKTGQMIPDTTCDNGSCSDITAALWTNTLTYGSGYRLDTMESAYFKQTADLSRNEIPAVMIQGRYANDQEYPLTYKVNISGTQEPGSYTNMLYFLASPDY